jgi:hypothetical protein
VPLADICSAANNYVACRVVDDFQSTLCSHSICAGTPCGRNPLGKDFVNSPTIKVDYLKTPPVYRKPRPFDLTTESLNVDQDGRADISLLELGCLDLQAQSRLEAENAAIVATPGARSGPVHS